MMKIYLDESGDLGYAKGSSGHFVIALLMTDNPRRISNCLKRIRKRRLKKKYLRLSELKFYNSSSVIRKRILECISDADIQIAFVVYIKDSTKTDSEVSKKEIYGSLTTMILQSINISRYEKTHLVFDRTFKKSIRSELNKKIGVALTRSLKKSEFELEIAHVESTENACIQAVDYIAGAIFQYYEHSNVEYFNIIKEKIITRLVIKE
jgi:hypothetical protein